MDFSDHTGVTNNFLHSLFSQCNVILNGVTITQASEYYHYSSYLETVMTYGTDAAATHLSNAYWYLKTGDMQSTDPSADNLTAPGNLGFIIRCHRLSTNREVQLFGRLHSDMYRAPILAAACQVADQIDESSTELLFNEQEYRFENRFKIFGRQITGQTRQNESHHIAGSQFDTEQGESCEV